MREVRVMQRNLLGEDVRLISSALVMGFTGALTRDSENFIYYVAGSYIASQALLSLANFVNNYRTQRNVFSTIERGI